MRKRITYVTSTGLAALLFLQMPVSASLTADGFTAVPEECEGEELVLTESTVDTSFTERDKDGGYGDAVKIVLSDEEIVAEGEVLGDGENTSVNGAVSADNHIITVSEEGVYEFTGTLSEGQIVVDADDTAKVQIILNNVDICCEDNAAVWITSADKVFLTLAENSENTVSDGSGEHSDADGAIFSKADLTIQGTGSLSVTGKYKHGIVSKDDLVITGGNLSVTAAENCLSGKDAVKIAGGALKLDAGQHAIKAKNEDDTQQGNIYMEGGKITADAVQDGMNATGSIVVNGGEMDFTVQDDGIHSDKDFVIYKGVIHVIQSNEGIEGHRITIYGGTTDITSSDDGMNASGGDTSQTEEAFAPKFQGGERPQKPEAPDGEAPQMPENGQMPEAPDGEMRQMPENGQMPEAPDGEMRQMPENGQMPEAPDGEMPQMPDNREMPEGREAFQRGHGGMGSGGMDTDSEAYIRICGGNIQIDASGDGLDSNGYFYMEGGTVLIAGPAGGADSALDYGLKAEAAGGTLIAAGSSGMAQGFGEDSEQGNFLYNFSETIPEESIISLKTSNEEEIISWRCKKAFQSVAITSPELKAGETCILTAGEQQVNIDI